MRGFEDEFFADPDHEAYRAKEQAVIDAARDWVSAWDGYSVTATPMDSALIDAVRALDEVDQ